MPRRTNSRLLKKEKKKLERQTFWFTVLSVLIGVGFLFVILPQSVRVFNNVFGEPITFDTSDTIPPQIPLISVPYTATPSAFMTITGFAEGESELIVVRNSEEADRIEVPENGEFSFELEFQDGENTVSAYSVDKAGNESKISREYSVTIDAVVPEIELFNLQEEQKVETRKNQQLSVEGQTEPKAKAYLNGRLIRLDADGFFKTSFFLQEGENELTFRAVDEAGNETEKLVKVEFRF